MTFSLMARLDHGGGYRTRGVPDKEEEEEAAGRHRQGVLLIGPDETVILLTLSLHHY